MAVICHFTEPDKYGIVTGGGANPSVGRPVDDTEGDSCPATFRESAHAVWRG